MEVFVKFEVFDTIYAQEDVLALRHAVGRQIQQIQESGKLRSSAPSLMLAEDSCLLI
jgi:hypothetical protein